MSQSNPMIAVFQRGVPIVGAHAANGWPVSSTTSSARTMRRPSVGRIDSAAAASTRASSTCSADHPDLVEPLLPPGPHLRVGGRKRPVVEQRLHVQHRPADHDGHGAADSDRLDVRGGGLLVPADGRGLGHLEHVELVVRDAAPLGRGQLRGADVHAAVELHRVGINDLSADVVSATSSASAACRCRWARRWRAGWSWLPDAGEVPDAVRRASVESSRRPGRRLGEPGQDLVGHPAEDRRGQLGQRGGVTGGRAPRRARAWTGIESGSWPPGAGRVRVFAPSATMRTPMGSAASSISVRRPGRGPAPRRRRGRRSTPAPRRAPAGLACPRTQPVINAHNGSSPGIVGAGRQRDPDVDAVTGECADRAGPTTASAGPTPTATHRVGSDAAAAHTASVRSATSAAAAPASSGTMTGADGIIAMALSTSPN